ncbi:tigger transposable element-derived protein 1-like [Cherax quadricarinatus]|uniref:tigger transposable element-derived protein 1-like n=1 Tax=Cherax quadricarinatus TaxID=27406 RepID=UPI00387ED3DA
MVAKKKEIKDAVVAKGVTMLTKMRSPVLEEVEKLLLVWINEKQLAGDTLMTSIICEKARQLHEDLVKKLPANSGDVSEFKASKGWFERFKNRTGIHSVVRHGEAASSDHKAAEKYVHEFQEYIEAEGLKPEQVFNCDETGLFWKKMPKKTFIAQEEKAMPGHKPMKDRLTLMFCANASGDFKVKPLLVYYSENPSVFRKNNVMKSKLCVFWKSNSNAWVTREIFVEWFNEVFGPSVKEYLLEKKLDLKCLLVMDNAPAHPPNLDDLIFEEFGFITVKFLPPNTTPLLQPMDQQVIANFKKLYTKAMFHRCLTVITDTHLTLREFWREHFSILHCITLIGKAWEGVTTRTSNSAWRKLWPDCVDKRDFEGFGTDPDEPMSVVKSIVALGSSMGLDVSLEDVEELVEDHNEELTTEELQELQQEEQHIAAQNLAAEEEEERWKKVPSSEIKEIFTIWGKMESFMEKHHPNKVVASHIGNMYSDSLGPF